MAKIQQKNLNELQVLLAEFSDTFANTIRELIKDADDSDDPKKRKAAQELKIHANELEGESKAIRKKYPHLFKQKE